MSRCPLNSVPGHLRPLQQALDTRRPVLVSLPAPCWLLLWCLVCDRSLYIATMPRLGSNVRSSCLSLPNAGLLAMHHHTGPAAVVLGRGRGRCGVQ